jgi:hypothetical protein
VSPSVSVLRFNRDIYEISALEIQSLYGQYLRQIHFPPEPLQQQEIPPPTQMKTIEGYVQTIQKAWRAYCSVRVYRYLKDIILNKLQGMPADLLRSIIPMEADFLDRASGIHIRFRLGGAVFPPKIYYKIYTHRPLCDINAFAPRNYSTERRAQPDPLSLHNKTPSFSSTVPTHRTTGANATAREGSRSSFIRKIQSSIRVGRAFYDATITPPLATDGMEDWYQREDDRSNPWRVISTELEEVLDPPPPWVYLDRQERDSSKHKRKKNDLTSSPTSAYHYSRLRRQQDILLEKKRRKREWMLKAYMLTAGTKGMAGGNDQPPIVLPREEAVRGDVERGSLREMEPRRIGAANLPHHVIEMCDSFSSRSELHDRHAPDKGREAASSEGLEQINDSDPKLLDRVSFPLVDPPPLGARVEEAVGGTDDALLKWRYGPSSLSPFPSSHLPCRSMALDYEEYSRGWLSMATSLPSEANYGLVYETRLKIN